MQVADGLDFVVEAMAKCVKELLEGSGGQVPLLRSMRELLRLLPDEGVRYFHVLLCSFYVILAMLCYGRPG
jgi:hypothetical protein